MNRHWKQITNGNEHTLGLPHTADEAPAFFVLFSPKTLQSIHTFYTATFWTSKTTATSVLSFFFERMNGSGTENQKLSTKLTFILCPHSHSPQLSSQTTHCSQCSLLSPCTTNNPHFYKFSLVSISAFDLTIRTFWPGHGKPSNKWYTYILIYDTNNKEIQ